MRAENEVRMHRYSRTHTDHVAALSARTF
jgi:hypothetical protein